MKDKRRAPLNLTFRPHPLARNRHFQTVYSTMQPRPPLLIERQTRSMMLDAGEGVRLQGLYSPQPAGRASGLVLLLHGWLGDAASGYNTLVGEHLYRHGYSMFRLNLRDHGETHHLNPGLFRGDLLEETFIAAQRIAALEPDSPFHIVGFSLGGNFALRLAWRHIQRPIPTLNQTVAICPVMDPYQVTLAIDHGPPMYLKYFRDKWRRAYRQKMAAFPDRYNFSEVLTAPTCMSMTEAFVRHIPYPSAAAYLASYSVTPLMMAVLQTPVTIICAADDPVVPVSGYDRFHDVSPRLHTAVQPYGGHVGFIDIFPARVWAAEAILKIFENSV